jgi:dTMP kinase
MIRDHQDPTSPCLVVFEGLDGSGKSRQVRRAASILRDAGHRVCLTGEPTGFKNDKRPTAMGQLARSVLAGAAKVEDFRAFQLLNAADRLEHVATTIVPAWDRGEIVVCDRYDLSTLLYGMAAVPEYACPCGWSGSEARGSLHSEQVACPRHHGDIGPLKRPRAEIATWLRAVGSQAPRPTVTIVITTAPTVCAERRKARGSVEFFDDDAFQESLSTLYANAATHLPDGDNVIHIDGSGDVDTVTLRVRAALAGPLLRLLDK